MTAIITGGETRQSLASVRALGRASIYAAVSAKRRPALAMWSRYAASTFLSADEDNSPRQFAEQIGEELRGRYGVCAFTSTDNAWWALSRFRDALPGSAQRILPPHYSVVRSLDLEALYYFAASLKIPCGDLIRIPENITTEEELAKLISGYHFPMLVRPIIPWLEREEGITPALGRMVIRNKAQMLILKKTNVSLKNGFFASVYNSTRNLAYFGVAEKGRVLVEGFSERLNELEPHNEVATLCETIEPVRKIRNLARTLLNALQWQGPFKVEFIRDRRGNFQLIEVVGRLWGSLNLAIKAGVNIPVICHRLAEGTLTSDLLTDAIPRVRMRWLLGDAVAKIMNPTQMLYDAKDFIKHLDMRRLISSSPKKPKVTTFYDVFELDDPMPFIFELQNRTWRRAFHLIE